MPEPQVGSVKINQPAQTILSESGRRIWICRGSAFSHLAEIVTMLTAGKVKKEKASKVEAALDGALASGVTEAGSIGSGNCLLRS